MKATDILRSEHEVILKVLSAVESIAHGAERDGKLDVVSAEEALEFIRNFADRCHHGKEEDHFFPSLVTRGMPRNVGPIAVMLADHDEGRGFVKRMTSALADVKSSKPGAVAAFAAAAEAYVALMRDHIEKENGVLFPMGDEMLSAQDQAALLDSFERTEHLDMGAGAHERFLSIAERLCTRLGVDSAAQAVASVGACCSHGHKHG